MLLKFHSDSFSSLSSAAEARPPLDLPSLLQPLPSLDLVFPCHVMKHDAASCHPWVLNIPAPNSSTCVGTRCLSCEGRKGPRGMSRQASLGGLRSLKQESSQYCNCLHRTGQSAQQDLGIGCTA
uniref:Uncharacterized protein n=1 Tax=Bubo bubo TaxID=30461 RepID=A0A8C0F3D2_BUBBB